MNPLKIGIVEDDLIIAEAIAEMLTESGYEVTEPATRYSEAIAMIEDESPDLLLLDINILGRMDGVEVARTVRSTFGIPFIFLTANTDYDTISRAKEVCPSAYLAKPITKAQLYAAIEIAAAAWNHQRTQKADAEKQDAAEIEELAADDSLFVKEGQSFRRVQCADIVYAESEQNYIKLFLADGSQPILRSTMSEFEAQVEGCGLLRVHRSYVVQLSRIEKVLPTEIVVDGTTIPASRSYREAIARALGLGKY